MHAFLFFLLYLAQGALSTVPYSYSKPNLFLSYLPNKMKKISTMSPGTPNKLNI